MYIVHTAYMPLDALYIHHFIQTIFFGIFNKENLLILQNKNVWLSLRCDKTERKIIERQVDDNDDEDDDENDDGD